MQQTNTTACMHAVGIEELSVVSCRSPVPMTAHLLEPETSLVVQNRYRP